MPLADGISFQAQTAGVGTFVFGAPRPSFLSLTQAVNARELTEGQTVSYLAQNSLSAPTQREWGHGTFSADGSGSIARTTVLGGTSGPGVLVGFTTPPIVSLTSLASDLTQIIRKVGPPTTTDIAPGYAAVFKDLAGGTVRLIYNDNGNLLGLPLLFLTPSVVIDTSQGNFAAYNLFDGTSGPYWTMVNAWNTGSLPIAQYNINITNFPSIFPDNVIFNWTFPATPNPGNVYAFPELVFGTQGPNGFLGYPLNPPLPTRISNFNNLSLTFNITTNFGTEDSDCIIETWVQPTADRSQPSTNEVIFYVYTPTANSSQVLSFVDHFDYSNGGLNLYIASVPDHSYIAMMPVTAPGGTTPLDLSNGTHTINFLQIFQALVLHGWVNGTNFLCGYEMGFEVAKNAGGATINSSVWVWN